VKVARRLEIRGADFWAGIAFIVVGVAVMALSTQYRLGSGNRIGPGVMPMVLGGLLALIGVPVALSGLRLASGPASARGPAATRRLPWLRPLFFVLVAPAAFAVILGQGGLVAATAALVVVAALADRDSRPIEVAILACVLSLFAIALFVWGLGLRLPIWPRF
jgi:hypothetical protein